MYRQSICLNSSETGIFRGNLANFMAADASLCRYAINPRAG